MAVCHAQFFLEPVSEGGESYGNPTGEQWALEPVATIDIIACGVKIYAITLS